ncbi:reverse transcriptase domain-containing protein [Tanacetum coccineum]
MSDIKGISPSYCTYKILMEDDYKLVIQPQRCLNPKVQDVVKNKIVKLLNSGLIYPISDSSWVSPIHVVPKKGGMTVDHFPLPFIDQMLERLCKNEYYCFLDGFSGFFQILITLKDQEKTTFTCPYGNFAHRRMPFGLCNAPATFQRCMTAIFYDMVEDFLEVFMDNFSEKCHFMVKERIVLGHKIYGAGIEVDRAQIDVIAKFPYPTNIKGVRSFLGHAGFYRSDFTVGAVLGQRIDGAKNLVVDHLSRLENPDLGTFIEDEIADEFPNEHLMILKTELNDDEPSYADYVNYSVGKIVPPNWTPEKITRFFPQVKNYFWDEPYAFKLCPNNVMRRCVAGNEILEILAHCHSRPTRGHHSVSITGRKVYESGFFWLVSLKMLKIM